MTRILMTTDPLGGVWQYSLDLARELARQGDDVALAVLGGVPSADQEARARQIPGLELYVGDYRLEWMTDPQEDLRKSSFWLLELARRFRPDVVHLNGYFHAVLPWRAPVLVVGHSCVLSWWQAVRREAAPRTWDAYRRWLMRGLAAADAVVAPSQHMLDQLRLNYGPLPRAEVIPNGRDRTLFTCGRKEPLVLGVGRLWDEGKNLAALARIAPHLPWPVVVAGPSRVPGETNSVSLHPGVVSLGKLTDEEVAGWMRRAAVYVLPARYEPFGLSPLEAALSGCALVLGDIPSLREVWGDAALYVPPDDEEELAHTVQQLIADPARLLALGRRARQRAESYGCDQMAERYTQLYRRLLRRARPAIQPANRPVSRPRIELPKAG